MKQKLAIFLSGTGSNARNICHYFKGHSKIEVVLLLSNNEYSGALAIGKEFGIPHLIFSRDEFSNSDFVLQQLMLHDVNTIVLAGFLWLIPQNLLKHYKDQIINIHPSLLPKYGGRGMHGHHVHQAVFEHKEAYSGITIHLCNEEYDKGKILFQQIMALNDSDTPDTIAAKVLQLEHEYYPRVIEDFILGKL